MLTNKKRQKNDMGFEKGNNKGIKFGDGQPANRGGSPKGKRISTILKELLGKSAKEYSKNKDFEKLDGNTALAMQLVLMAFSKDDSSKDKLNSIKEILDRIEGKSVQTQIIKATPTFNVIDGRNKE